jgi:hypothetical protein
MHKLQLKVPTERPEDALLSVKTSESIVKIIVSVAVGGISLMLPKIEIKLSDGRDDGTEVVIAKMGLLETKTPDFQRAEIVAEEPFKTEIPCHE